MFLLPLLAAAPILPPQATPYRGISVSPGPFEPDHSDPGLAINHPDAYAWQVFCALNRELEPGSPYVVWQAWIDELQLFADPTRPPAWDESVNLELQGDPAFGHVTRSGALEQVKDNPVFFEFVRDNELWYQEGLVAAAEKGEVAFPILARVVKATWRPLREGEDASRFFTATQRYTWKATRDGTGLEKNELATPRTMVLVALGLATKDLPNWFWATFEHVDSPGRRDLIGALDRFGTVPAFSPPGERHQVYPPETLSPALLEMLETNGLRPEFRNYRLRGTQVSFVDSMGRPTLLANSVQEIGAIATSSCMTCHARASVNHGVARPGMPKPQLEGAEPIPLEFLAVSKSALNPATSYAGAPDPDWFLQRHSGSAGVGDLPIVFPVDFLWQLPLQTKSRKFFGK